MALYEMRKVYIMGDLGLRDSIIKRLGDLALFQPRKTDEKTITSSFKPTQMKTEELEDKLSRLNWTIKYLEQFDEKKTSLGFFPGKTIIKGKEFFTWIENFDWQKIHKRCEEFEEQTEVLREEKNNLEERYSLLLPWRQLPISTERLEEGRWVGYQLGMIRVEAKDLFRKELEKLEATHLNIIKEEAGNLFFLLIFLKEDRERLELIFQRLKVEKVQLKEFGVPERKLKEIHQRIDRIENQIEKIKEELKRICREKIKLMALYDHFYHLLRERKVSANTRSSPYTFLLEGWIRKIDLAELKTGLKGFSPLEIVVRKPHQNEESKVPVALSNTSPFKPFELVTNLYGLPRYFEIDPTPFLAPFFALFMAICLTDGGYGIILSVLSYLMLKKFKVEGGAKKLFNMLFIVGFFTFGIGLITGGVFGIEFTHLPVSLAFLKKLALLNPIRDPMTFLAICLGLGLIHVLVGIGLELWEDLRRKDIVSAVLDHASWIVLILGIILVAMPILKGFLLGASSGTAQEVSLGPNIAMSFSFQNLAGIWNALSGYSRVGLVMFLWGVMALFLFVGRKSRNLFIRLAKGGYELYGIVQLFADVLSYSRLLALGLATSVIATVVNTIAGMSYGTPFIGPILMVMILIGGHLGNLVLNCLSGFIHTSRLQFVEFFGKFYQGGGKSFRPFRREGKYVAIR
ncbi:MAG: V-type ATP synthase subunit I [bacterium]